MILKEYYKRFFLIMYNFFMNNRILYAEISVINKEGGRR